MFAKIFSQIFDSSIRENPQARFTFMDMLILADVDGVVDMTHESIAARTNRPISVIRSTITELEGPDPRSRTPDNDGRRLVRLDDHRDWGWMIVNYDRFRRIASEEQRREKTRIRTRKYRENLNKTDCVTPCDAPVTHGDSRDAMQRQRQRQKKEEGGGNSPHSNGVIGTAERITFEKSLDRISNRLVELKECDLPGPLEERKQLRAEKSRILALLGLKA